VVVEGSANTDSSIVEAGTFGLPLMRRFNVTFDYFRRLMYLEPSKSFGTAF
jgi:hypothetical protein